MAWCLCNRSVVRSSNLDLSTVMISPVCSWITNSPFLSTLLPKIRRMHLFLSSPLAEYSSGWACLRVLWLDFGATELMMMNLLSSISESSDSGSESDGGICLLLWGLLLDDLVFLGLVTGVWVVSLRNLNLGWSSGIGVSFSESELNKCSSFSCAYFGLVFMGFWGDWDWVGVYISMSEVLFLTWARILEQKLKLKFEFYSK